MGWLVLLLIIGALLGGNSLGEIIRGGLGCVVIGIVLLILVVILAS